MHFSSLRLVRHLIFRKLLRNRKLTGRGGGPGEYVAHTGPGYDFVNRARSPRRRRAQFIRHLCWEAERTSLGNRSHDKAWAIFLAVISWIKQFLHNGGKLRFTPKGRRWPVISPDVVVRRWDVCFRNALTYVHNSVNSILNDFTEDTGT